MIGKNIQIVVSRVMGNRVTIGIEAPDEVHVMRGELLPLHAGPEDEAPPAKEAA